MRSPSAEVASLLALLFGVLEIRLAFLIGSDPPPESNRHQATSGDLQGLENDHRNLNLRCGNRRKSGKHDVRERYSHCGGLGGNAIGHSDRVFLAEPEYG